MFNQVLLVNTAKFYHYGLGMGYKFPEVNEWTDLVVGYIYFVKHNEEDLKWVIKENIDKFEDKYIVAFFVKLFWRNTMAWMKQKQEMS